MRLEKRTTSRLLHIAPPSCGQELGSQIAESEVKIMTKKELIHEVAYETGIQISESKEIVDAVFKVLTETLIRGEGHSHRRLCDLQDPRPACKEYDQQRDRRKNADEGRKKSEGEDE